jgi:hypothetical protein
MEVLYHSFAPSGEDGETGSNDEQKANFGDERFACAHPRQRPVLPY